MICLPHFTNSGIPVLPGTERAMTNSSTAELSDDIVLTYSVMFYYTPELASHIEDIDDFISTIIDETNFGKVQIINLKVTDF